eukprot:IDg20141t1
MLGWQQARSSAESGRGGHVGTLWTVGGEGQIASRAGEGNAHGHREALFSIVIELQRSRAVRTP